MWVQTVLVLVLIRLSEETCVLKRNNRIGSQYQSYLYCTEITPKYDLRSDILSEKNASIEAIIISNSSIPELNQSLFYNTSFKAVQIQANVEIVESSAFESSNISSLTLDYNHIRLVKDQSFNSPFLQVLSLQNNNLTEIKLNDFNGLSSLKMLNLKYNNISNIEEDSFDDLTSLEELHLSFNELNDLHFGLIKKMTNLRTISLNNNALKALSDRMFSQCKTLEHLYIENNHITLIEARYYPNTIRFINVSNNHLTSIDFSNLVKAEEIDLSYNKLTSILGWFYNLPALKYLYLSYNSLGPSININTLHNLKNLTLIALNGNGLQKVNNELFKNLPHLKDISLAENNLTTLDFSNIDYYFNTLTLRKNSLYDVKNLSRLQDLTDLDLSFNNLEEIKYDMFEKMKELLFLSLEHNAIHTIYIGCFRDLTNIRRLKLGHNKITVIEPGAFTGLRKLLALDLSYNDLSHLDENVFHDNKLIVTLNIAYNNIKNVEVDKVLHQVWFRNLTLDGNHWTCKDLSDLVLRKPYLVNKGKSFNVTNVYGIACNNTNGQPNSDQTPNSQAQDMSEYLNSIEEHTKDISYKMTVSNVVLIVLLTLLCVKFCSAKCFSCCIAAKQFLYKRHRDEENVQLI